ncbi:MAG: glycosyl transferase [Planctomycetales bacterium 12-60-4]|nr:MAG: glycosyl transferase [Planctomycetales bacterium 12-60-4]
MSPTRIAFVIPTLDRSGAEKQLSLLATRLPRDEFEPHVIALTRGGPYATNLAQACVSHTVLNKRWKCDPIALWKLQRTLRSLRPHILHTWLFAANAYGRLALPADTHVKRIVSERCVDSWKAGWQLWLDRRLIPRTELLIGNSPSVVDFYRHLGVPDYKLRCIPNGVEPPPPPTMSRAERLKSLGIPQDAYVIGYIGRLAIQKRVRDLIWAAETLWQIRPQLHLVIIGDGPERKRLEDFSDGVHGPGHVHFLGHREDAQDWLTAFDVFWLGSSFEGMSNSVLEAMSAGLPVVATDIPANRELVVPDETGYLVRPGDPVGFMQFTRTLMDDSTLAARLGAAGQQRARENFSVERMVQRHIDIYREFTTG